MNRVEKTKKEAYMFIPLKLGGKRCAQKPTNAVGFVK